MIIKMIDFFNIINFFLILNLKNFKLNEIK